MGARVPGGGHECSLHREETDHDHGRCPHLDRIAWYDKNSGGATHPVGKKDANAWGLHDMLGNVWEWCEDPWHDDYEGAPTDPSAWATGGDSGRVGRGGSWHDGARYCRAANRNRDELADRNVYLGFRLALSPAVPAVVTE